MEPNNNLENQFRDKLNAREIQPSPMAWDRLDAMLTVAENKKPKRKWNWLLIAASFVGILFAGFAVYELQSTKIDTNNGIVIQDTFNSNQNNNDNQKSIQKENSNLNNTKNQVIVQTNTTNTKIESKNKKLNYQNLISNQSIINQKMQINENQNENENQIVQVNQKPEGTSKVTINVNPETLLAQVENSQTEKTVTLPQQIKVNANSLLSEVDGEVTQEFRETKLSKLKRNFQSVKSALVSRNDK